MSRRPLLQCCSSHLAHYDAKGYRGIGELNEAMNKFDSKIILDPMIFSGARFQHSLEERLERIISASGAQSPLVPHVVTDMRGSWLSITPSNRPSKDLAQ